MGQITTTMLEDFIVKGFMTDLYKHERAISVHKTIGNHANEINSSKKHIKSFLAYTQNTALNEAIISLARIYDNPSSKNVNRCIKRLKEDFKNSLLSPLIIVDNCLPLDSFRRLGFNKVMIEALHQNDHNKFAKYLSYWLKTNYHVITPKN